MTSSAPSEPSLLAPAVVAPPPRRELRSHGAQGDALLAAASQALDTLRELLGHADLLGDGATKSLRTTVDAVTERMARNELSVLVVGEKGSGKTTFLDAIAGDRDLGAARGRSLAVSFIRKGDAPRYRAKLSGGRVEDFARRVPDKSPELSEALNQAVNGLMQKESDCAAAAHRVRDQARALARAEAELKRGFKEFEVARQGAQEAGARLMAIEERSATAQTALATVERTLPPVLLEAPHWWAVWLWLLRVVYVLTRRDVVVQHEAKKREVLATRSEDAAIHDEASRLAEECAHAEARLTPLGAEVETLRKSVAEDKAALPELKAARERARKEVDACHLELRHHAEERRRRFFQELAAFGNPDARGAEVVEIEIEYPARFLPDDIAIIDAPGVTLENAAERQRAFNAIRERADGCILIAELDCAVSQSTTRFLHMVKDVVPHVLLALTKMDRAFVDARRRGSKDPWEQVEQARRIGTRRFAREIGRKPEEVLSISIAAQAVLDDESSGLSRRFESETAKLFQLLRHERALIIGSRAASAIRRCIAETAESSGRAEQAYEARIAALEAERLPDPRAFGKEQLALADSAVNEASARALAAAESVVRDACTLLRARVAAPFSVSRKPEELLDAARAAQTQIAEGIAKIPEEVRVELQNSVERSVLSIENDIFDELRRRYRLVHEIRRESNSFPMLGVESAAALQPVTSLAPAVEALVTSSNRTRLGLTAGVALVAGLLGWLLTGPFGVLFALAGVPAFLLAARRAALVRRALVQVDQTIEHERQELVRGIEREREGVRVAIHGALEHSLEGALQRFARLIEEPLEAERLAIEREQEKLTALRRLAKTLEAHDALLVRLMTAAADASIGLCR